MSGRFGSKMQTRFISQALIVAIVGLAGLCHAGVYEEKASFETLDGEVDLVVAEQLARSAVLDLGLRDSPTPTDYQLSTLLLSLASDMAPGNGEYARLMVASAWSAGDSDAMIAATRRVIEIDPKDTVAQLRLVSSLVNSKQTIEGRLSLYNRFLGNAGKSLDVSVRSRLALDAALLEREQGNAAGFLERLRLATQLDISNKAAASLASQYYSNATDYPIAHLEYQIKLLFADPLDPNVHLTLARIFAKEGAFEPARRFLKNATNLFSLESGRSPSMIEVIRFALKWQIEGPQSVADELNPVLSDKRATAQAQIDSYIKAELPIDDLVQPSDIRYDIDLNKLRLFAAYNAKNAEDVQAILLDIEDTVNSDISSVGAAMNQRDVDTQELLNFAVNRSMVLQVMRAVVGMDPEKIREDVAMMISSVDAMRPYFAVIEPMALYAEGEYAAAIEELKKFQVTPLLELINALSHEQLGETEMAVEIYFRLSRAHSLEGVGAFARSKLIDLGKKDLTITLEGQQMIQIADTIPNWIDQMITRPSTFVYIGIVDPERVVDPMEQPKVSVRLRNLSPIPLAVGPSQPLDSRFLLVTRIDNQSKGFQGEVKSKVIELDHRLRLEPFEELVVQVDADSFQTQWLMGMQPNVIIRQRWRLLQGFKPRTPDYILERIQPDSDAAVFGITHSPLGLTTETTIVQRLGLEEAKQGVDELIVGLESSDKLLVRRAVRACAARLTLPMQDQWFEAQDQGRIVGSLIDLYTRSSVSIQCQMILQLPHRHQVPAMIAFDDHVVSSLISDALINSVIDPSVLACVLLTRTDAADSPIFDVLDQVSDPRVVQIAEIIKARIEAGVPMLGVIGPGVESMIPPKEFFGG